MHGHRIYQWTPYLAMDPVFSHVVHCTPYLGIDPAFSLWLVFSFPSRSLSPLGALHAPRSFVPLAPYPSVHTSAKRNKSFGNAHPTLPSNALLGTRTPGERAPERAPVLVRQTIENTSKIRQTVENTSSWPSRRRAVGSQLQGSPGAVCVASMGSVQPFFLLMPWISVFRYEPVTLKYVKL